MAVDEYSTAHPSNRRRSSGQLLLVERSDAQYAQVEKLFLKGWKHPHKPKPVLRRIYKILFSDEVIEPYTQYHSKVRASNLLSNPKKGANEQLLFHGTTRTCLLGEDNEAVYPCSIGSCSLCCIVRKSFDVRKCGTKHSFRRFGTGIYTTRCSSKADDYFTNKTPASTLRVLLLNRVVVGRAYKRQRTDTSIKGPPSGYHSVLGVPGIDLNYEETVVYGNDAIRPAFIVVYEYESPPASLPKSSLPPPPSLVPSIPGSLPQAAAALVNALKAVTTTMNVVTDGEQQQTQGQSGQPQGGPSRKNTGGANVNVNSKAKGGKPQRRHTKMHDVINALFKTPVAL